MQTVLYFASILLTGALTGFLAAYAWRQRSVPGARAYAGLALGECLLALAEILSMLNPTQGLALFWVQVRYLALAAILVLWLVFALAVFRFQFLKRAPAAKAGSAAQALEAQSKWSLAVFLLIFAMMAAGITATGYASYQGYQQRFRNQMESTLSGIAALKVDELLDWRKERLADAGLFYQNDNFSELVRRYLEIPDDTDAQKRLAGWLEKIQSNPEYERVFLLDAEGRVRISSPAAPEPVDAHLIQDVAAVLRAGQVTFVDFHRHTADGPIYLALMVPIFAGQDNRPLGILVLRIDPRVYLYPFIQQWPVPSSSAETLLVRREGDYALFLNELRFQANTALNLRVPLENTQLPAAQAALGQAGIVEGVDYSGVAVIADVRAVPGSPWFLVTHVDTAEVYAPLRERLWQTLVFFGALMMAFGAGLGLIWRQQRARYDRGQVEAAQALRASEELYRSLFENMLNGFAYCRMLFENGKPQDFIYLVVNDAFETLTGLKNVAGRRVTEVIPGIRETDPQLFEIYGRVAVTGQPERFEMFVEALQMWFWISVYSPAHEHFVAVFDVITERKRAEEALRASEERFALAVQGSNDGLWDWDIRGKTLYWSPRLKELLGYAEDELEIDFDTFGSLLHPEDKERVAAAIEAHLKDRTPYDVEERQRTKSGEYRWYRARGQALWDEAGNPVRMVGFTSDITECKRQEAQILAAQAELQRLLAKTDQSRRALLSVVEDQKKAEEEIRQLNAELEQRVAERTAQLEIANKELEAFSYSVSHDLRAPLRGIDGWSLALLEDCYAQLDDQARQYLDRVRAEAQRMGRLIDDLLQLSRVTRAEMQRRPVDLTALAQTVAARLKEAQPDRRVEFVIQPGLTVHGDARLLEIALSNLLGNACKFTGTRPLARIEFSRTEVEGRPAFFVRDNGVGFDMAYAQKLFGAFQRMHKASEFPGTGIGLATVQRIVHRHGGRAWAEAHVDQGATFYFTIPA